MEQQSAELGTELVLDNRKLIIGFVLLVTLCGACFVIGFMEGKRQAIQTKVDSIAPAAPYSTTSEIPSATASTTPAKAPETVANKDPAARERLDWYKSVQRAEGETGKTAVKTEEVMPIPDAQTKAAKSTPAAETAAKGEKPPVPVVAVPAAKVSYSVQVGAFRQLSEAEAKVSAVKAKGFDCAIEPPTAGNQLYLVKVGNYAARADALSMQRKLTKAGLSCFIKTN